MPLEFSTRQQTSIVAAVTILSVGVIVSALLALAFLVSLFLRAFSSVFLPLAVAGVLALVVKPYYAWFLTRLKLRPALAVILVFASLLLPVILLLSFFGAVLASQAQELFSRLPEWFASTKAWAFERIPLATEIWERYGLEARLRSALEGQVSSLVSGLQTFGGGAVSAGAKVMRAVGELFSWAVLPVYFAFFLMMRPPGRLADNALPFLKPETREDVVYLVKEFISIIVSFFRGQMLVALLQGLLFALGFGIAGLRYGFILGLVLGFLNVVPYLGSMIGLAVCLPLAFFQEQGGWTTLVAVVAVFAVVQLIEGYLLTPRIMGEQTGLHPMVIMVSIFFWGSALGGILGMILAIPLTAFLVVFWRLAREKYIQELV